MFKFKKRFEATGSIHGLLKSRNQFNKWIGRGGTIDWPPRSCVSDTVRLFSLGNCDKQCFNSKAPQFAKLRTAVQNQ